MTRNLGSKSKIKLGVATGLTAISLGLSTSAAPQAAVSLIDSDRNMAVLNDANLSDKTYDMLSPGEDATQFRFELKGYVFGIRIMRSFYSGWYDQTKYALYADIKTSGLGALLKKLEIWAVTRGRIEGNDLVPEFQVQQNYDKKNRRVEMNYDNRRGRVDVNIVPPIGSQGVPRASEDERYKADDALTAILNIMMRGWSDKGEVCEGTIRVFDSKQHYGLRMERDGTKRLKFDGEKFDALRCNIYYEPISGFDPEDLPSEEEGSTPIKVYFQHRPELGLYTPIRFTYKISAITAVIKVDQINMVLPGEDFVRQLDD